MAAHNQETQIAARKHIYEKQIVLYEGTDDEVLVIGFFITEKEAQAFDEKDAIKRLLKAKKANQGSTVGANEVLEVRGHGQWVTKPLDSPEDSESDYETDSEISFDDSCSFAEDEVSDDEELEGIDLFSFSQESTPIHGSIPSSPASLSTASTPSLGHTISPAYYSEIIGTPMRTIPSHLQEHDASKLKSITQECVNFAQMNETNTYCIVQQNKESLILMRHLGQSIPQWMESYGQQRSLLERFESIEAVLEQFENLLNKNYLHGDVKPDNVMVKEVGDGWSYCFCDAADLWDLSGGLQELDERGTPTYRAPEQGDGTSAPTLESEIYSLSFVLAAILGYDAQSEKNEIAKSELIRLGAFKSHFELINNVINFDEIVSSATNWSGAEAAILEKKVVPFLKQMVAKDPQDRPSLETIKQKFRLLIQKMEQESGSNLSGKLEKDRFFYQSEKELNFGQLAQPVLN